MWFRSLLNHQPLLKISNLLKEALRWHLFVNKEQNLFETAMFPTESMQCRSMQLTRLLRIAVALSWNNFRSCPWRAKEEICWVMNRSCIESILAECDAANDSSDFLLPPVTPLQLVDVTNHDFSILIQQQHQGLLHTFDTSQADASEELFNDMKGLLSQNARIKKGIVQTVKHSSSFVEAWAPFDDNQFSLLKRSFGGLASVFLGTATVESDFSMINWEKNNYCASLTDFSFEEILHSKQ
jgi:hypothetical protein